MRSSRQTRIHSILLASALGLMSAPVVGGTDPGGLTPLVMKSFRVPDVDGDMDGYPDTNETVDLFVTVANKSDQDLTHVVGRLTSADPRIECIVSPVVTLSFLAAHAALELPRAFRFKVSA